MLVKLRKNIDTERPQGKYYYNKDMYFKGLKRIVKSTPDYYELEGMQKLRYTREMFDYIKVEIIDVDYECNYNVVFPDTIKLKFLTIENVTMELEDLAEIDRNDYATVEVYDVEWEVI